MASDPLKPELQAALSHLIGCWESNLQEQFTLKTAGPLCPILMVFICLGLVVYLLYRRERMPIHGWFESVPMEKLELTLLPTQTLPQSLTSINFFCK